jgi:hypothetical protein
MANIRVESLRVTAVPLSRSCQIADIRLARLRQTLGEPTRRDRQIDGVERAMPWDVGMDDVRIWDVDTWDVGMGASLRDHGGYSRRRNARPTRNQRPLLLSSKTIPIP